MALDQTEQRLRAELRRKKSALQNAISNANVNKKIAESPDETAQRRAQARDKYNKLQSEVAKLRKEVSGLESNVKKEQARKNSGEVKKNYDRLKEQYDLIIDKTSPEAVALANRVNAEVKKLNDAYQASGQSTRVSPIGAAKPSSNQPNAVTGSNMPFGGKSVAGTVIPPSTSTTTTGPTGPVAAVAKPGAATGNKPVATTATGPEKTPEQRYADAIAKAQELYQMPDILFRNIPSLGALLKRYVEGKLTDQQFALELQNDPWYRSNSAEIKARYVQLFNYEDLVKSGRATGTTDYEQQLARIVRTLQARARELNGVEIPDDQAKLLAKDLYIYNLDSDPAVITERLVRFIRPTTGMVAGQPTIGYGGQALETYQNLQAIAKANGFKLEDILPRDATGKPMSAEGTLEQIALGKLDINRLAQDVRKLAAIGQPDYVKDLLGQGYNLDVIYAPYKERMATVLELDPNTISLSDPTLRMGISPNGEMNLYDFERALRKDSRWQYTSNAREDVSNSTLQVLRDFGFQG